MGQQASTENQDLEDGVKTVVLIHGLASCALRGIGVEGAAGFLCDNCRSGNVSRLVYVSISELAKRPYIVKGLGLAWEPAVSKDGVETMNTSHGYHNILVNPVEGLDGIKSLNPGAESNLAPILLWQTVIDSLSDFNLLAINYDWRRWGDLIYIEQLVEKFQNQVQMAVRISRQPTVMIAHSLGAQVITYMMGVLGAAWTQAHISDVILVGPATMGSPSVFAAYANGPSTITHSSVVPVASFLEQRLRDVASTWPGLLSVMPTALDGLDTFGGLLMAESPQKTYGGMSSVEFLEDLAACEDDEAFDENTLHERARKWMEKHLVLNAHRAWRKEFQNAAVMRKGFELHVSPNLRPPSCRVHVIYSDGIDTPSRMKFQRNLYHKCQIVGFEKGDDTLTAKSVEQMYPSLALHSVLQDGDVVCAVAQAAKVAATERAFALGVGRVVTWGHVKDGGDCVQHRSPVHLQATQHAFAAIWADGSVTTWGDSRKGGYSSEVHEQLHEVQEIQATADAFAALRADGRVVTWGDRAGGGDSSSVETQLREVQHIQATSSAFWSSEDFNSQSHPENGWGEAYQYSKRESELRAKSLAEELQVDFVSLCPSFILGPERGSSDGSGFSVSMVLSWMKGEQKVRSLLIADVRDVATAHVAAAKAPKKGGRFIVSTEVRPVPEEVAAVLREVVAPAWGADSAKTITAAAAPGDGPACMRPGAHEVRCTQQLRSALGLTCRDALVTVRDMASHLVRTWLHGLGLEEAPERAMAPSGGAQLLQAQPEELVQGGQVSSGRSELSAWKHTLAAAHQALVDACAMASIAS
eukprot:g20899.t1